MSEKILYVEDDPDIQMVVRLALEKLGGFTVKIYDSGQQALDEVEAYGPDLVMLDVMMPGMDGPQILKALQKLQSMKAVPVLFITAKTQKAEVDNYLELGVRGVISKPFDPMTLAETVRGFLKP